MTLSPSCKISIGMLAYNEAQLIDATLASLFQQTLFTDASHPVQLEIIVVPNGCTDDTATVAETALRQYAPAAANPIQYRVCPLEQPGKANAWNHYIHQFAGSDADYIFLMDADIQFLEATTLTAMVDALEENTEAWVSVDQPVKSIALKANTTWAEKLSLAVSKLSGNKGAAWICGQLYCGRGERLREIHLPTTLSGEDSFIYTMVTTNLLSTQMQTERVIKAPLASHSFEAYLNIRTLFRHERWLVISNSANQLIYDYLQGQINTLKTAGSLIKQNNEQNPLWVNQLIQARAAKSSWIVSPGLLFRRFINLRYKSLLGAIALFPLALAATCVDLIIILQANQELRRSCQLNYGGKQA